MNTKPSPKRPKASAEAKLLAIEAVVRAIHYHIEWFNPVGQDNSCKCGDSWPCQTIVAMERVLNS